jgi:peptidyl-prolyl cis-trans isomerase SurA
MGARRIVMAARATGIAVLIGLLTAAPAGAEVLEEIVAKVNDDIITMSELEREEQGLMAELYRQFTGDTLDAQVREARAMLLQSMIDSKLLMHRAERIYDMSKMREVLLEEFMAREGIANLEELERLLARQGQSVDDIARRLMEIRAPAEVIRLEVTGRLSVGDKEVQAYYDAHAEDFEIAGEVMLREIVLIARGEEREQRMPEAEQVHARLLDPDADFADIATEVSEASSSTQGGLIGPFHKGDLVETLEDAAFTLPPGVISEVLVTDNGLHVIKVESRTEDSMRPFDEVKEELRIQLEDEKYSKALEEFLKKARDEASIWISPKYAAKYSIEIRSD